MHKAGNGRETPTFDIGVSGRHNKVFDKTVPPMKEGEEERMRKSIAAAAGNWSGKSIQSWTDGRTE